MCVCVCVHVCVCIIMFNEKSLSNLSTTFKLCIELQRLTVVKMQMAYIFLFLSVVSGNY